MDRGRQLVWAMLVANLAYGALITLVIENRTGILLIGEGAKIGAIVGFLLWCTVDFVYYGTTNIANVTRTVVDPLLEVVHGPVTRPQLKRAMADPIALAARHAFRGTPDRRPVPATRIQMSRFKAFC